MSVVIYSKLDYSSDNPVNYYYRGDISSLNGGPLNLVDKFSCLGNSVSPTEKDINTCLEKGMDNYR